ncbi:electron transport complex subunit RsxC [Marinimicrobium sp. ABcell2]|uniref:electron transport complex subunit RsxC n=1 Tax=Marinimicrobium sp. ABcell2 TaxID=3069751 RepID=UPI0027B043CB|nr:electron transport complex subunit RsxC [Marinimicrobium sp. ABcell2]MDQ2078468.1 electron transport complex subunit RsxC [Marinimicrobium sp. ABcell2]
MGSLIKTWEIPGGVHPPENKAQSLQLPLGKMPLPPTLFLPLNQHIGTPAKPVVEVGDRVLGGQLIADAEGVFSARVHAPTSGKVSDIKDSLVPHPSGMSAPCIIIEPDGADEWVELHPLEDYLSADKSELLSRIRAAGIAGLGGAGFPTSVKLNPRADHSIDTLILNGTECEPYITADDVLMQTRADEVIAGSLLLAKLLDYPEHILVGVEDNKPEAIAALQKAAAGTEVQVVPFPTKYPSGGEKQLIQILTGREVPSGQIPATIGVVCQNVGTAASVYRAVRFGEPLVSRITTVVGEALQTQRNVEVLLGTPIDYLLEQHGFDAQRASRLVMGGPMMGFSLPDASVPVIKTTNCILAPSKVELPPPAPAQACIRCGLCAEACPASLLPQQLFWYAQAEDYEKLESHNLFDCIECGACSYVCPSNIPLVQYYRAAKGTIRHQQQEKEKSDRARRRFEFRQERIAKEEAEKEAKRAARKQAAEEAKRKLAEQKSAPVAEQAPAADSELRPVSTAQAQATGGQPSRAVQQAKLERNLVAAQSSLTKAREPLTANEPGGTVSQEQLDKQQARIKQAELKVREAEKKLQQFQASSDTPTTTQEQDPVAAAIARARAKVNQSPEEKLRSSLESLYKRLSKAEEKAAEARAEGSDKADALQQGVDKLKEKIATSQKELDELAPSTVAQPSSASRSDADHASLAIEKAKAKAAAMATMSAEDKLRNQIESLKARLEKAQERLAKAEAEGDENVEAFRTGVSKLEDKLQQLNNR